MNWVTMDEPMAAPPRNVFRLRMYFRECIAPAQHQGLLEGQIRQHEAKLQTLLDTMADYQGHIPEHEADLGNYILLDGAILREKAYIAWLHNVVQIAENRK